MKSSMHAMNNTDGNQTVIDKGVYKRQKVDVKGLPNPGTVIAANFEKETVTVEIEVPADKVLEV